MKKIKGNIYDFPVYYDLVFGADWAAECHFLEAVFQRHVKGKTQKVLEPACGTGRLMYRLAKNGFFAAGLDLNPLAVDYCNARMEKHGFGQTAWVADMTDFQLPVKLAGQSLGKGFDAAFNTINSFRHLLTEKGALAHLDCMAGAVRPGGIYALGLHLSPTIGNPTDVEAWSARRGHLAVNTYMWPLERDKKRRIERFGMRFDVYRPTEQFRIEDELVLRSYTAAQFDSLIAKSGRWTVEQTYDFAYSVEDPVEIDPTTEDVVYILKRLPD